VFHSAGVEELPLTAYIAKYANKPPIRTRRCRPWSGSVTVTVSTYRL